MRAGRALRQIVIAQIEAEVSALAGRVFDQATADADYPYASLGPSYWNDRSVACIESRLYTLQIDVWHGSASKGVCEDLVDDISAAMVGWSDTDRIKMHPFEVSLVRVMDDPNGSVHGVIQIEALVEATSA